MQEENQKLKECPSTNMQKSIGQPSDNEETEFEEVEEELSNEIIQNPDAFTRVLDRPEIQEIVVAHHAFQDHFHHLIFFVGIRIFYLMPLNGFSS